MRPAAELEGVAAIMSGAAAAPQPGALRVLTVDDDARMLASVAALLEARGYLVEGAGSGEHALQRLAEGDWDALLLDINLPGMSGLEVLDQIERLEIDVPVIVVSGDDAVDVVIHALRRGICDFLRKPYEPEVLLRTVGNACHKRRLESQNRELLERLEQSEQLHRYLVDHSPDLIYMLDSQGRFIYANRQAEELLGYAQAELLGRHYTALVCEGDEELARFAFAERRTGERASRDVELRLRCRSGATRQVENRFIDIALAAVGVYAGGDAGGREFVGTYGVARDVTERKRVEAMLNHQAFHDTLTGLPNRRLLQDRLDVAIAQARRSGEMLAVMLLGLDRFKLINDTLGHAGGDELLRSCATRLRGCLRDGDTLARISGDEFALLLPGMRQPESAGAAAQKLLAALAPAHHIDGEEVFVEASIGVVLCPNDSSGAAQLLKHADIAMRHGKDRRHGPCAFYYPEMADGVSARMSLETQLRKAIEGQQLAVHYQPQMDVESGRIVAVEALVRWQHPERGAISPLEFIPMAEETGLILALGEVVARLALGDLQRWRALGLTDLRMALNLSSAEIGHPQYVARFLDLLREFDVPGSCIELEITESGTLGDPEAVAQRLRRLSEHGIRIAIDDFGTGYSSLSYLDKLPVHTIKIDRSFVQRADAAHRGSHIVAAIIAVAKGLGHHLIAEGVETEDQATLLRAMGCRDMQGYHFGRPMSAGDLTLRLLP